MELFLRKIDDLLAWEWEGTHTWLQPGDIPTDTLNDLRTKRNSLSVWCVEPGEANLQAIAAALMVHRNKDFDRFTYVLFSETIPSELGIQVKRVEGDTADHETNMFHRDLSEISAGKLAQLARKIHQRNLRCDMLSERELITAIFDSLKSGRIKRKSINDRARTRICDRARVLDVPVPDGF
ncbi:MAG: hypothetical protein ACREQD_10435 [Candidatus Binataceae bacterium]